VDIVRDEVKLRDRLGAKAGAFAGFVFGIANAAIEFITFPSFLKIINSVAGFTFLLALVGAIVGALFGVLFVRLEDSIPGRSMIVKGIIFMLVFWLLTRGYGVLRGGSILNLDSRLTLVSYTLAGALFGYLLKKLK
jgi:hypothetical protein